MQATSKPQPVKVDLFVSEAWALMAKTREESEVYDAYRRGNRSLERAPGRVEIVMMSYQRTGVSATTLWHAPIIRENGTVRLGAF